MICLINYNSYYFFVVVSCDDFESSTLSAKCGKLGIGKDFEASSAVFDDGTREPKSKFEDERVDAGALSFKRKE